MTTIYVSPQGSTKATGTSVSAALSITCMDKAIQLAGPGGTVVLIADQGTYNVSAPIDLTHGGTAAAPVTIVGQDHYGNPANAVFNGTRPAVYSPSNPSGNELFRFFGGASNLDFSHMTFNNVGTAFRAAADISNISLSDMTANNVQRFFADRANVTTVTATVSGLDISNVEVHGFSKDVVELKYDSHDIVLTNVFGDSERQDGDGIAMGVHLDGTVHNVEIVGCTMLNAVSSTTAYWNGDGFATERGVYNVTFKDCVARGNADGGFDLKSSNTLLVNSVSESNAHNYRFWGNNITVQNAIGTDPMKYGGSGSQYQIQVVDGATVNVVGGSFADSGSNSTVVIMDGGNSISFSGTHFIHAEGARFSVGSGIHGIDLAAVISVAASGTYSVNGSSLLLAWFGSGTPPTSSVPLNHAPDLLSMSGGTTPENSAQGTLVAMINGHDPDGDSLRYSLADNAGGRFTIDAATGAITVASGAVLDFEQQQSLSITVVATDTGGLSLSKVFAIDLSDVNEAAVPQTMSGTSNSDILTATTNGDYTISGLAGDDKITTIGGADNICGGSGNDTILSGAGNDTITFSGSAEGFDCIDTGSGTDLIKALSSGTIIGLHSVAGVEKISANGYAKVAIAGSADSDLLDFSNVILDRITKISGGGGGDTVIGSSANDVISGDGGADTLSGGGGNDVFVYAATADSTVIVHDTITDFQAGIDKIDLKQLDANSSRHGKQAFVFLGDGAFTGHAGELRVDMSDPRVTHVYADLNGDRIADFQIDLSGAVQLHSSDFLF